MFRRINFKMGATRTIPFIADMIKIKSIDVNGVGMIINVDEMTPVEIAIALLFGELTMLLSAPQGLEISNAISFDELVNEMILSVSSDVQAGVAVNADIVEKLGMFIQTYQVSPEILIEEAKNSLIRNNLILQSRDNIQVTPTIRIEEARNDMVLHVTEGIEIRSLHEIIDELSSKMEIDLEHRVVHIYDYDPQTIGDLDPHEVDQKVSVPFELALRIKMLEDDDGKLQLALYATDGLNVIIGHPTIIGTIDPKKLGELDPFAIPDATYETI